jgi:endoglucanase
VNPNLLIAVQGLDVYKGQYGLWGGVFLGQLDAPLNLTVPNKLIFETHDLGPSTFNQVGHRRALICRLRSSVKNVSAEVAV